MRLFDVPVNKMDLVGYSEEKFLCVAAEIKNFLASINVVPENLDFGTARKFPRVKTQ